MSNFRVRERSLMQSQNRTIGQFYWTKNGSVKHKGDFVAAVSPGVYEKCFDEAHEGPPFRTGGPFMLFKLQEPTNVVSGGILIGRRYVGPGNTVIGAVNSSADDWRYNYSGGFAIGPRGESLGGNQSIPSSIDSYRPMDPNNLDALGAGAYDKLRPKVERAGVFQALAEAREIPRMLQTTCRGFVQSWKDLLKANRRSKDLGKHLLKPTDYKSMKPKELADQFLNAKFGWHPFVREVNSVLDTIVNFQKYVDHQKRINGKWMKRVWHEKVVQAEDSVAQASNMDTNMGVPTLDASIMVPRSGIYRVCRQQMTDVWYEGSFRFYQPEFDEGVKDGYPSLRTAKQALSILGANVTPVHLYNIVPWTWMIDWFANVKHNIQLFEDLATGQVAARYMYLMRHSYYRWEYQNRFSSHGGQSVDLKWYRSVEVKRRVPSGSYFQFSLHPDISLSPMQQLILVALGISKG